jgi:uncharacterized protein with PIN domain
MLYDNAPEPNDGQCAARIPPPFTNIRAVLLRVLQRLLPCLAIPARCPSCETALQLTREDVVQWGEDFWVQGIRYWRCPHCGQGEEQEYHYLMYPDCH